jgi:hypothetical protein
MRLLKKQLLILPLGLWSSLGFYRGINYYNYKKERENKIEKAKILSEKINNYYYTECLYYGVTTSMMYVFPLTFPFMFIKEILRIEIVIRNLNDEKSLDYYYGID